MYYLIYTFLQCFVFYNFKKLFEIFIYFAVKKLKKKFQYISVLKHSEILLTFHDNNHKYEKNQIYKSFHLRKFSSIFANTIKISVNQKNHSTKK